MDCDDCTVDNTDYEAPIIIFCPLHQAAPKLLDACKKAVARLTEVDTFAQRSFILLDKLGCSVTKSYVEKVIENATRTP